MCVYVYMCVYIYIYTYVCSLRKCFQEVVVYILIDFPIDNVLFKIPGSRFVRGLFSIY